MNIDYIKKLIIKLGFTPRNGENGIFVKYYDSHNNYPIFIDFNNHKIEYAHNSIKSNNRIKIGDLTTSNFDKSENFVVLECIDRLLIKGYSPECLELEKKYPLGHNLKGKLDILVYDKSGRVPFLMIECKTWGNEYEKESSKTLKSGGQIFSYYQQDKAAKYLCLYTSHLDEEEIEYKNNIVLVEQSWHDLSSAKDVFDYWNKNFKDNGIFENFAAPYDIKPKALTYGMLKNLKEEDSGKIYNQIMEILRHNAISDKPNAFNKLLNLFVCKIIDENQNPDDELKFQWLESDTDETLQMRLNDLYKAGMWRFLEIKIIDHSEEEVTNALEVIDDPAQKQRLIDMFIDTRLKKSPNFAFVEVLDDKTFKLNAKIVREIVELLQVYKFRYQQKHEFLGNFFELLLNTSMKQEAGQFFTPVPITRFIISSLPLKEFVQSKINSREKDILPVVIDYACGSGHFLTEYMNQMQNIIENNIDISNAAPDIKNLVETWKNNIKFAWAKKFVYGIDLDNRLVKTAKVSAFFNGDGEANIIWANGLDNFEKSEEYRNLLEQTQPYDKKNNGQFDILISNPPYSVEAFKSTLKYGAESFELYDSVTDNSSEIECLFVERMKQLLKVGGWAGIILPSSILSNSGIHSRAREIIFKYFKVKAIVELGSGTFMKTGTNTIVLFLERRSDNDFMYIKKAINTFITNLKDVTVLGIENAFSKYVVNVYENLKFDDYVSFLSGKASVSMQKHELYSDYFKAFGDDIYIKAIEIEKEKMLYFLLTYSQTVVLVKTGEKKKVKEFLGYEFSERRGHEGMKHLPCGTKLFDESNLLNPQKTNTYIYNAFLDKKIDVDVSLSENIFYRCMSEFISYGTSKFDKAVNLNKKNKIILYTENSQLTLLGDVAKIIKGQTLTSSQAIPGDVPVVAGGILPSITHNQANRKANVITVSASGANAGYVNYWDIPIFATDCNTIVSINENVVITKYLYICLKSLQKEIYKLQSGQAQPHVYERDLRMIGIPIPSLDIQKKIVEEIDKIEEDESTCLKLQENLQKQFTNINYFSFKSQRLGDIATMVKRGKSAKYGSSEIQIIKSGQARGYLNFDFSQRFYVSDTFVSDERNLEKGDILINSTGVGTAGRVTLFNLEGKYVVDSHITIVRINHNIALSKYVLYALANIGFKTIESMAKGQSGQIELALDTIKNINIPLPPINKQQEIVVEIENIESNIATQKVKLNELKLLKDNILKKYL